MLYHSHSASDVLDEFKSNAKGLHQIYAEARLREQGVNHLRLSRRSLWHILTQPFASALMLILLVALAISSFSGNIAESTLIAIIIVLNASLGYWQSFSHERTLRVLESEATGKTCVRRDGIDVRIDAVELVPGDVVILRSGNRIPADGRIIHSSQLIVNQLQLTGSSEPVAKHPHALHSDTELVDRSNMVYRGTYVTSGSAQFVVTATGNHTEYGKLLQRAARVARRSSLQQKISQLTHLIVIVLLCITAIFLLLGALHGMPPEMMAEYTSAIVVAAVPATLAFAIAIVSTLGLHSLLRHHALVRHTHSIEPISLISTIISDKTGMLTRDALRVVDTWLQKRIDEHTFLELCRQATLNTSHEHDTHDSALTHYAPHTRSRHIQPMQAFAFEHSSGMSGNIWHRGNGYRLVVKGTPERILRLADLTENEHEQAHSKLQQLAMHGHQVLAIAWCDLAQPINHLSKLPKRTRLHFVGFVAFAQQLKPEAKHAVAAAQLAGIRVRMVTGDHLETAYSLAQQLGIAQTRTEVFDARKLAVMTDSELTRVVHSTSVFARVAPEQKHRLLSALRRHDIVAITGDSTDDIPSLIQAHIGISTTHSSLLARDASDLILLDNNFATTLNAIKWSRTIMGNIRRMFLFVITTNIAEMAIISTSLAFAIAPALLPVQLLWINLVVSLALVIPIGLEPHSRNIMHRRPVSPRAGVLPRYLIIRIFVLATTMALLSLAAVYYYSSLYDDAYVQTIVFVMFVAMQLVSALSARSDHTSTLVRFRTFSPLVYGGIITIAALQITTLSMSLGTWLGLVSVNPNDLIISSVCASVILLGVSELLKWHSRRTIRAQGRSYA